MAQYNVANDDEKSNPSETSIPRPILRWLLLFFDIPAVACTLFLLCHLLLTKTLRQALHNHVIIVLLFVALSSHLIDIPFSISYLYFGYVWLASAGFCSFWWFVAFGLFDMITMLLAWGAVERHILVFHQQWVNSRRKRFLFHYLPLSLVILYDILFYIVVIFFPSCENIYDYTQPWCGLPCYHNQNQLLMYDILLNCLLPVTLVVIFSTTLFIRFIHQRQRVQQVAQWRRHQRMVFQLLSVSLLPVVFILPLLILVTAHTYGLPAEIGADAQLYFYFFGYFVPLLLPYLCLVSLRKLWRKLLIYPIQLLIYPIQRLFNLFQRTNAIAPNRT